MTFHERCVTLGPLLVLAACLAAFPGPAAAQTVGAQVGASVDPDQFYFGGHVETPPVVDRLHFRPNVEVGLGNDLTLIALNFEFVYRFLGDYPWKLYAGGGPALNIIDFQDNTEAEGGFNIVVGVAHDQGLFVEIKAGALDSPDFKVGVGYVFR
jgi:hypothetical protein